MKEFARRGWVLYDGDCGFCSKWVPFWSKTLARRGFDVAPLQSDWVRERIELSPEEIAQDLRLLLTSGELISGANVYRHVMRRIWWAWPFYWLTRFPVLSWVFDACYRGFARRRHRVSRMCRLP